MLFTIIVGVIGVVGCLGFYLHSVNILENWRKSDQKWISLINAEVKRNRGMVLEALENGLSSIKGNPSKEMVLFCVKLHKAVWLSDANSPMEVVDVIETECKNSNLFSNDQINDIVKTTILAAMNKNININ